MARAVAVVLCAVLVAVAPIASAAQSATSQSEPVTITGTITAIDQANRIVTLKGSDGLPVAVKAPEQVENFKSLKVGDQVTATYFEAMAVQVRKPGDPAPAAVPPITTTTRTDGKPGSTTRRSQTFSVSVQAVDAAAQSITVKGPQGNVVTMKVRDPKQLQNVKAGDMLDVTYYESLLVKFERPKK
jgi:phage baseplate assembly protein gpV